MFLVRSAFWLSAAFIVMAPSVGMDVGEAARSTGNQLISQGAQTATEVLLPESCTTIECMVGRSVLIQVGSVAETAQAPQVRQPVAEPSAFPPPRPDWAY